MNRHSLNIFTGIRLIPRVAAIILAASLSFMICAASIVSADHKVSVEAVQSVESKDFVSGYDDAGSKDEDSVITEKTLQAFDEFMKGDRKATYRAERVAINYYVPEDIFEDRKEYYLSEISGVFQAADEAYAKSSGTEASFNAEYAILNKASKPLLALRFSGKAKAHGSEDYQMHFVLNYDYKTDKISVAYGCDAWSRNHTRINSNGIITNYGDGGAFMYMYIYDQVTGDGDVERIYTVISDYQKTAYNEELTEREKKVCLSAYWIHQVPEYYDINADTMDYYTLHSFSTPDCTFIQEPAGLFDSNDPVYALYTEEGKNISDSNTVILSILKKMQDLGITPSMFFASSPEWKEFNVND